MAHQKVQHKKKVTNKQVDRLETTLGWTRLLEKISPKTTKKSFKLCLKIHHFEYKVEELLKEKQRHLSNMKRWKQ